MHRPIVILAALLVSSGLGPAPAAAATPCSPGTYSATGETPCDPAPPGTHVAESGATSPVPCTPGSYQPLVGQTSCIPASPGHYVDRVGSDSQTPCSPGKFQSNNAAITCIAAAPGTYVPDHGATSTIPCARGTYQPTAGRSSCMLASAGHFVSNIGSTSQSPCAAGTFQSLTGQTSCQHAQPGHYVASSGSAFQTACAPGSYQSQFGATACSPAPPGSYVPGTGATAATPCAPGSYQPSAGHSACIPADPGYHVPLSGATAQLACPAGTFAPNPGSVRCDVPPRPSVAGPFTGEEGQSVTISGAAPDDDDESVDTRWSVSPGPGTDTGAACSIADPGALQTSIACNDDGTYYVTLTADDGIAPPVSATGTVVVENQAPLLRITSPADGAVLPPLLAPTVRGEFTDSGSLDTHTCLVDFGDGTQVAGTVSQGASTCTASHGYLLPGEYTISMTVTDDDGASDTRTVKVISLGAGVLG